MSSLKAIVITTLMMLFGAASASDDSLVEPLRLEVLQLTARPSSGLLLQFNRPVSIHLRITNQTDDRLLLEPSQLQLLCEHTVCRSIRPVQDDILIDGQRDLGSGETIEGWVRFQVVRPVSEEPSLVLTWRIGDSTQTTSVNRALRDLVNARHVRVGYQRRIAILSVDRSVDLMTLWVLSEQFRMLKEQGIERLVLQADPGELQSLPTNLSNWLRLADSNVSGTRRIPVRGLRAPVQFREFHMTGFRRPGGSARQIMHQTREQAVSAAARTLYERLSVESASAEFTSPESGIRRAVLECTIDRLDPPELTRVLDTVRTGFSGQRQLVLEMLDRVSDPQGLQVLRMTLLSYLQSPPDTSKSFSPGTAVVAAQTLVRCIVPGTNAVMHEVWDAAHKDRSLRETIVREILRTHDYRWTRLAAQYAAERLDHFSVDPAEHSHGTGQFSPTAGTTQVLHNLLRFLHNDDRAFPEVAARYLLRVTSPPIQDELLRIVVDSGKVELARECIVGRLDDGAISKSLLEMIHRLPDSRWTERLADLGTGEELSKRYRTSTFMAAVRCATGDQLNTIIDTLAGLDRNTRSQLFQQLSAMNHPRCTQLLQTSLEGNDQELVTALTSLKFELTPEMLQGIVDRYEVFRISAVEQGDLNGSEYRIAAKLLAQLGTFDHPEARRMINLSLISPAAGLREAARQLRRSDNRSRTRIQKAELWELRRSKRFDEAMELVNDLLERDPFDSDLLTTCASLNMRKDQLQEAQACVIEANRLSPGDVITESTVALLQVRLGQLEPGLANAETVLKQVPDTAGRYYGWTLYNTACVYARALETKGLSTADKQQHRKRAVELLHQAADAGIHDESHVVNDPDLVSLHDHPDWSSIIDRITTNQDES
ncbi:MAG: hypothetical protein MK110_06980 [Fuerstiella sp.]|nr:hypothetical protein [Fuerstiella sp.]